MHTFDEVITTIPRAVDCDRNMAIFFATYIDREGRAIIRCDGFQRCSEAKKTTERITSRRGSKPLKVRRAHFVLFGLYGLFSFFLRLSFFTVTWLPTRRSPCAF